MLLHPTFQNVSDLLVKVIDLEGREEAQGPQVESHDRRHGLLEERGRVQQGPVPAQTDDEVDFVSQIVLALLKGHQFAVLKIESAKKRSEKHRDMHQQIKSSP